MAERFTDALGKQLFVWVGWVFTVGGAIGSFVIAQAYAWIGWLCVGAGLLAVTAHAIALHRRVREFEETNRKLIEQALEADRRLNTVSMAVLEQLAGIVSAGVSGRLVELIVERVGLIERLRRFQEIESSPLKVQKFVKESGQLYAIIKATTPEQAAILAEGDAFTLVRKAPSGVTYDCARMRVNQPPKKNQLYFVVSDATSGELTILNQLADGTNVNITGYLIHPIVDVATFPEFGAETVVAVVRQVIAGFDLNTELGT